MRACSCLTNRGIAQLVAALIFAAFHDPGMDETKRAKFSTLMDRHGLLRDTSSPLPLDKDLSGALVDMIEWFRAAGQPVDAGLSDPWVDARFENFRILESGQASAAVIYPTGQRQNPKFERTPDGWRLDGF